SVLYWGDNQRCRLKQVLHGRLPLFGDGRQRCGGGFSDLSTVVDEAVPVLEGDEFGGLAVAVDVSRGHERVRRPAAVPVLGSGQRALHPRAGVCAIANSRVGGEG